MSYTVIKVVKVKRQNASFALTKHHRRFIQPDVSATFAHLTTVFQLQLHLAYTTLPEHCTALMTTSFLL